MLALVDHCGASSVLKNKFALDTALVSGSTLSQIRSTVATEQIATFPELRKKVSECVARFGLDEAVSTSFWSAYDALESQLTSSATKVSEENPTPSTHSSSATHVNNMRDQLQVSYVIRNSPHSALDIVEFMQQICPRSVETEFGSAYLTLRYDELNKQQSQEVLVRAKQLAQASAII